MLARMIESDEQISFVLLPKNDDTYMYSYICSSWENGIPLNKLFIPGGDLLILPIG